ncbi:Protein kinase domain-containing protein ppk32 [Grifola frondosa]|uniref:Protein kinase domain-containing protein ppk32 n=1 Tax=Grifola frondosa TaxID=5627 RepID=A0A1C7MEV3_GRIFR|nr:Protein kinase domain-containing protein ppk32 [Grifola frondosa]
MLAAATSFFARTNISQSYNIGAPSLASRTSSPAPSGSSAAQLPTAAHSPPFNVGPWRVQSATHKVTHKRVSVWSADKKSQEMERMGPASKERTLEVLKAEASALGRLRHPSILEMVEPLEETRNELIFATEPVLSSLHVSIPGSFQYSPLVELDEVEIQKGILQLCKGLSFLHTSAHLIHTNINPESVVINAAGDWKLSGLGLTIPFTRADGGPTRWEFPTFDGRVSPYTQRSFDYIAPEYALDEVLDPASDMYSLGCLIYAVHCKGNPPFKNHGGLGGLRDNAGKPLMGMERLDQDLRELLNSMITRTTHNRPTPSTIPVHPFFSSLPVSTLNFLDRSNFAAKSREEKISFMKGLTNVLDKFSEGLRTRKILPSLLEEMKDTQLLPYILPNIFAISQILSSSQFATLVLPSLKPLFAVKEPPQNMLTLLDNLQMLQNKTEKPVFREHVLPLVYNALESEHAIVQERALKAVPDLCETIDYAEVQGVLFPRVALVFTKTRMLTVKVATLITFLAMVKTLDQASLTQKLVPLLSKIRTKEPAVTMATLAVQEAMGLKVDREAVATLVLPQLWAMSMGPLLTVSQFKRFMEVIRKLGDRVEKEHDQFLRDSQRTEDRSATTVNGASGLSSSGGAVDFESLVGNGAATVKADTIIDNSKNWDDDVWGSIFTNGSTVSALSDFETDPRLTDYSSDVSTAISRFASTSYAKPDHAAQCSTISSTDASLSCLSITITSAVLAIISESLNTLESHETAYEAGNRRECCYLDLLQRLPAPFKDFNFFDIRLYDAKSNPFRSYYAANPNEFLGVAEKRCAGSELRHLVTACSTPAIDVLSAAFYFAARYPFNVFSIIVYFSTGHGKPLGTIEASADTMARK